MMLHRVRLARVRRRMDQEEEHHAMSNSPNPNDQPDPYDPYARDPYAPGGSPEGSQPYPSVYQPPSQAPPGAVPPTLPSGAAPPPGPPPPNPYPAQPPNTSAIVLTVLSGVYMMTGYCIPIGIAPLILGILGIVKNSADPEGAAKLTRIGWIVFAALTAVLFIGIAIAVIAVVASSQGP